MFQVAIAVQLFKPHNTVTRMCPTTVIPFHVQQKDHGDFMHMCHDDPNYT